MAYFREYLIDEIEPACVYLYRDCSYVLEDDLLLPAELTFAWCYSCASIVAFESIPGLEELDSRIRELENLENKIIKSFGRSALDEQRLELPIRRRWRMARQSTARCLACGARDTYPIVGELCTEPRFHKRFRQISWGFASMTVEIVRRLTPEGLLIDTDEN